MENYSGGNSRKFIPKSKLKKMKRKMIESYKEGERLTKIGDEVKKIDEIEADEILEKF